MAILSRGKPGGMPTKMKVTKSQLKQIINEELETSFAQSVDQEIGMAVNQLQAIASTALELSELIKSMNYVPEWGDGKISVALNDLSSLRSHLIGKGIGR